MLWRTTFGLPFLSFLCLCLCSSLFSRCFCQHLLPAFFPDVSVRFFDRVIYFIFPGFVLMPARRLSFSLVCLCFLSSLRFSWRGTIRVFFSPGKHLLHALSQPVLLHGFVLFAFSYRCFLFSQFVCFSLQLKDPKFWIWLLPSSSRERRRQRLPIPLAGTFTVFQNSGFSALFSSFDHSVSSCCPVLTGSSSSPLPFLARVFFFPVPFYLLGRLLSL
jgi:hypothetical protein